MVKWKQNRGQYIRIAVIVIALLLVVSCWQSLNRAGEAPALVQIREYLQNSVFANIWKSNMPVLTYSLEESGMQPEEEEKTLFQKYFLDKMTDILPVYNYAKMQQEYNTQIESELTQEMILALEGADEATESEAQPPKQSLDKTKQTSKQSEAEQKTKETGGGTAAHNIKQKISLQKLNDFDYLVQNFYQVDRTTTINSSQLSAQKLMEKNLALSAGDGGPQILIYHTHSQEGYADSGSDKNKSVVGVGEYLAKLLQEQYGLRVLHDTGEYDLPLRDNAYSQAAPALERILAENPSIEVVIDLHRDGVGEGVKLASEVNGKPTAQVMFFNGLSRTTSNGDIAYLKNPYIEDNLAFSFQMKLKAEQYYPEFARSNYLKGYRYNLHYCPKSLLVEVGAQTNTTSEAMNAMEPLADLLHKVLKPQ